MLPFINLYLLQLATGKIEEIGLLKNGQSQGSAAACKPHRNYHIITLKFSWISKPVPKQTIHLFGIIFTQAGLN